MSDPTASFAIALRDEISGSARSAKESLLELKTQIDADKLALRDMKKAMRDMKGSTTVSASAFRDLKSKIDAKKASIAAAQEQVLRLGGAYGATAKPARTFLDQVEGTEGPIGRLGGGLKKMKTLLRSPVAGMMALAAGAFAVVVGLGALIVATLKAGIAVAKYALAQADAFRSERLRIEGLNTLYRSYGRATASAHELQAAISGAADSTNRGRDELSGYGRQLARFGVRGRALTQAVEAMGIAALVQGERGAQRFLYLARNAQLTGRSVREVADAYKRNLGGIARRQMASLDNQTERFKRNVSELFSGLRLDGFLSALQRLGDQFSQSTVTGRALKHIVETVFQPLIDDATNGTPVIVDLFQRGVLGALRFQTFLRELKNEFLRLRLKIQSTSEVLSEFFSFGGGEIGAGVREGIEDTATDAADAARRMASRVSDSFRDALGIRSPSRVFRGFGGHIAGGVADGMRRGITQAERSAAHLAGGITSAFEAEVSAEAPTLSPTLPTVSVPVAGHDPADASTTTEERSTAPVSISIGDVHVSMPEGVDSPRDFAQSFREELARLLSGVSIEMGAAA